MFTDGLRRELSNEGFNAEEIEALRRAQDTIMSRARQRKRNTMVDLDKKAGRLLRFASLFTGTASSTIDQASTFFEADETTGAQANWRSTLQQWAQEQAAANEGESAIAFKLVAEVAAGAEKSYARAAHQFCKLITKQLQTTDATLIAQEFFNV